MTRGVPALVVLSLIYLVMLVWLVLWKLDTPYVGHSHAPQIKLVPFVPSDGSGGSAPVEVVANVLLFVPFGIYLGLLAPSWRWWTATGVIVATSLLLEGTQLVLAIGVADISDVVANTAGGLVGLGAFVLARRRLVDKATRTIIRVGVLGTLLAVIALGVFIALPHHYRPPSDFGPLQAPGLLE